MIPTLLINFALFHKYLDKLELYIEYRDYCREFNLDLIHKTKFLEIWDQCFSHVKVREFKNVCGKCQECAELSILRTSFRDSKRRHEATQLHAFHRAKYMGESAVYYQHQNNARQFPDQYCSIIYDGMAQSHTILPWEKNLHMSSHTIDQHLQGVIQHGQWTNIYRSFGNIGGGSNLAIHVMLLDLFDRYERDNKLPGTLYLRNDGGSENSNKTFLAICELLVASRICQTLYVTRLPVGHTHEDIDGVFSRIWTAMRNDSAITPQDYMRKVREAINVLKGDASTTEKTSKFVDLLCVPDYKAFMEPHIDQKFGRCFKEQWTQLCFRFQAVTPSEDFPNGVEMHYRYDMCIEVFY